MNRVAVLAWLFTILLILCRLAVLILMPLWIDNSQPNAPPNASATIDPYAINATFPYFLAVGGTAVQLTFWGPTLLVIWLAFPHKITEKERNYPRKWLIIPGALQASSSILMNYSASGSRTPPYLQAVLNNFNIPLQFAIRFLILRKRPTLRKFLCACVVMASEFVCLLPSIFPGLESQKDRREDEGASGAGAILWPLCRVSSMIPYCIANVLIERSMQEGTRGLDDVNTLNMAFYQFWFNASLFTATVGFFWVDIIPGFGTSANIHIFWEKFYYNLACLFGGEGCGPDVYLLAWSLFIVGLISVLFIAYQLRYSEGANFFIMAMTLRSPILLLIWTLFDEHPFHWHPHVHLSTWLSIGALVFMLTAVILYSTGAPEKQTTPTKESSESDSEEVCDDRSPLLSESRDEGGTGQQYGGYTSLGEHQPSVQQGYRRNGHSAS